MVNEGTQLVNKRALVETFTVSPDLPSRIWPPWTSGARSTATASPRVQWEVYGDWSDDPAELRTDIYYRLSRPVTRSGG